MIKKFFFTILSVTLIMTLFCISCNFYHNENTPQPVLVEGIHYLIDTTMVPCYDLEKESVNIPANPSTEVLSPEEALKIAWPEIIKSMGTREVFETIIGGDIPVINSEDDKFWMIYFPSRKGYFGGDMYIEICKNTGNMRYALGE